MAFHANFQTQVPPEATQGFFSPWNELKIKKPIYRKG